MRRLVLLALVACHGKSAATHPGSGITKEPAPTRARVQELEQGCKAGDLEKCTSAGMIYYVGAEETHIPVDWARAKALVEPGCAAKNESACAILVGILDEGGHGAAKDEVRAKAIHAELCAKGRPDDCRAAP